MKRSNAKKFDTVSSKLARHQRSISEKHILSLTRMRLAKRWLRSRGNNTSQCDVIIVFVLSSDPVYTYVSMAAPIVKQKHTSPTQSFTDLLYKLLIRKLTPELELTLCIT